MAMLVQDTLRFFSDQMTETSKSKEPISPILRQVSNESNEVTSHSFKIFFLYSKGILRDKSKNCEVS